MFHCTGHTSLNIIVREFSSQAGARSKKEDDGREYELSDNDGEDVEFISGQDSSSEKEGVDESNDELLDNEVGSTEKESQKKLARSELFKAISRIPSWSVNKVLAKWVEEGKELSRSEISLAILNLRALRMYQKALQVNE